MDAQGVGSYEIVNAPGYQPVGPNYLFISRF